MSAIAVSVQPTDHKASYPVATVTRPDLVRRLVADFNAFRIVQPGDAFGCTLITGQTPELHFEFRTAAGSVLAAAGESPCAGVAFSVGSRPGPALQPQMDLTQLLWSNHILPVCSSVSVTAGPLTQTPPPVEYDLPFGINDTGAGACGLRGYPQITRLQQHGMSLVPHVTRIPAGSPVTPPVVLIDPGSPATTSIDWPAQPACKALPFDQVQMRLPGTRILHEITLKHSIAPCGGRLLVAPI